MTPRKNDARRAALAALRDFRSGRAAQAIDIHGLPERDKALAVRLFYGVLQNYYKIDACIAMASNISKIQPHVRDILRLGMYQLLFLDKIPKSAAVDESVKLVGYLKLPDRARAFVNAVLRNAASWNEAPRFDELWIETSHPRWLVDALTEQEGFERAKALLEFNNGIPPIYLQMIDWGYKDALLRAGAEECPGFDGCLTASGNVEKLPGFAEGAFIVADNAARMAVIAAAPAAGERVLDACAAPGGKSVMLSHAAGGGISLTSCDINKTKVNVLRETLAKYGVSGLQYILDAAEFNADFEKSFDLVLADVPCSGIGVIRKKPDIRFKAWESVQALPGLQLEILENLSRYVKPGGRLVYVTCTVLKAENRGVAEAFLERHNEFAIDSFSLPFAEAADGDIQLWPPEHGTDGFYIERFRWAGK